MRPKTPSKVLMGIEGEMVVGLWGMGSAFGVWGAQLSPKAQARQYYGTTRQCFRERTQAALVGSPVCVPLRVWGGLGSRT